MELGFLYCSMVGLKLLQIFRCWTRGHRTDRYNFDLRFLLTISFFFFSEPWQELELHSITLNYTLFLSSPFLFRFSSFLLLPFFPYSFLLTFLHLYVPLFFSLLGSLGLSGTSFNSGNIHLINIHSDFHRDESSEV